MDRGNILLGIFCIIIGFLALCIINILFISASMILLCTIIILSGATTVFFGLPHPKKNLALLTVLLVINLCILIASAVFYIFRPLSPPIGMICAAFILIGVNINLWTMLKKAKQKITDIHKHKCRRIIISAVLILIVLLPVSYLTVFVCRYQSTFAPFAPYLEGYSATTAYISGGELPSPPKMIVIRQNASGYEFDPVYFELQEEWRAQTPGEVNTVVIIGREAKSSAGTYTDKGHYYTRSQDITVVNWQTRKIVIRKSLGSTSAPYFKIGKGDREGGGMGKDDFLRFIESLVP
jgi:hypothetical protein